MSISTTARDDFRDQSKLVRTPQPRARARIWSATIALKEAAPKAEPETQHVHGPEAQTYRAPAASLGKAAPAQQRPERAPQYPASARGAGPWRRIVAHSTRRSKRGPRAARDRFDACQGAVARHPPAEKPPCCGARHQCMLRSDGAKDFATALRNDPSLTAEAASGRTQRACGSDAHRNQTAPRSTGPGRSLRCRVAGGGEAAPGSTKRTMMMSAPSAHRSAPQRHGKEPAPATRSSSRCCAIAPTSRV